jgi:hypothetical protein
VVAVVDCRQLAHALLLAQTPAADMGVIGVWESNFERFADICKLVGATLAVARNPLNSGSRKASPYGSSNVRFWHKAHLQTRYRSAALKRKDHNISPKTALIAHSAAADAGFAGGWG